MIIFSGTPALYNSVAPVALRLWLLLSSIPPCAQIVFTILYSIFFPTGTDEYHFGVVVDRIDLQWQRSPASGTSAMNTA